MAIMLPLTFLMARIPGANSPQHAQTSAMLLMVIVYGSVFAVQALTRPVYGISLILFYYDQRIRQEAFDIEWMMLKAGLVVPPPAHPQFQPRFPPAPVAEHPQHPEAVLAAPEVAAERAAEPIQQVRPETPADPTPQETTLEEKSLESNASSS